MLSLATRRLTASERTELADERARRVAAHARRAEELRRAGADAARAMLWIVGFFALILAFNVSTGHLATAVIAGAGTAVFLGLAAWLRSPPAPASVLDDPTIVRLEAAIARDEVQVTDIRADVAVTVRAAVGDDAPQVVGDLLRTAAGQVVYLSRALCPGLDEAHLPNAHLRITCAPGLGIRRVEPLGERVEPRAVVDVEADAQSWCCDTEVLVWTPDEDRCESLDLCETTQYPVSLVTGIDELTAAARQLLAE